MYLPPAQISIFLRWFAHAARVAAPGGLCRALAIVCGVLLAADRATAADPRIDHIDRFQSNSVLVHFDIAASRVYELQACDSLRNATQNTGWTTLYISQRPPTPFPDHFIYYDPTTNRARFYRLKVTTR